MKLIVITCLLLVCCEVMAADIPPKVSWVEINGKRLVVEIPATKATRSKGLMFRDELAKDSGMLFVFPNERRRKFWMKNMLIPLDIVYIDSQRRIVSMALNAQSCVDEPCASYPSGVPARYVLEINAGDAAFLNLKVGDEIDFGGVMQEPE